MPHKIVFLNGPPGSGKDYISNYLNSLTDFSPSIQMKFSDPLKVATHAYFNQIDYNVLTLHPETYPYVFVRGPHWYEDCLDTPLPEFFGFSPKYVYDKILFGLEKISGKLRQVKDIITIHALLGLYTLTPLSTDSDNKNYVGVLKPDFFENSKELRSYLFNGSTPRKSYIWLSEDVVKIFFDIEFFGKVLVNRIDREYKSASIVFISDSGFAEEASPVVYKFGAENCIVFNIYADKRGKSFKNDSRSYIKLIETVTHCKLENQTQGNTDEFCVSARHHLNSWLQNNP